MRSLVTATGTSDELSLCFRHTTRTLSSDIAVTYQSVPSNEDTIVLAHVTNEGSPTLASLVSSSLV